MKIHDSPLARKLGAFVALSDADLGVLSDLFRRRRRFAPQTDMIFEGQVDQSAYVVASGWVCSYKLLKTGGRQIVDFQIPGDFLGLRSVLFRTSDHNIEPVTEVEASELTAGDLLNAFHRTPRLATAVLWAASRDEAMVVEHLVGLGRRDATERMAHFLLELYARLRLSDWRTSKAMTVRCHSIYWPMHWDLAPSTSTGCCGNCATRASALFRRAVSCLTTMKDSSILRASIAPI